MKVGKTTFILNLYVCCSDREIGSKNELFKFIPFKKFLARHGFLESTRHAIRANIERRQDRDQHRICSNCCAIVFKLCKRADRIDEYRTPVGEMGLDGWGYQSR